MITQTHMSTEDQNILITVLFAVY